MAIRPKKKQKKKYACTLSKRRRRVYKVDNKVCLQVSYTVDNVIIIYHIFIWFRVRRQNGHRVAARRHRRVFRVIKRTRRTPLTTTHFARARVSSVRHVVGSRSVEISFFFSLLLLLFFSFSFTTRTDTWRDETTREHDAGLTLFIYFFLYTRSWSVMVLFCNAPQGTVSRRGTRFYVFVVAVIVVAAIRLPDSGLNHAACNTLRPVAPHAR